MNSEADKGSHAFVEVAIHKMEKQDKSIEQIEALIHKQLEAGAEIKQLASAMESLDEHLHNEPISEDRISALTMKMDMLINKLATTPANKVLHHHHVPGIIWGVILLAIILCMVCAGWLYTYRKLDDFIANDTRYRALRLDTALQPLRQYLDRVDSVYATNSGMRDEVIKKEQEYQDNFYRVQKALRLREEARKLEKEAGKR